ncbi:vacuolar fusion protein MON1, partial [Tanacetum coccineum]
PPLSGLSSITIPEVANGSSSHCSSSNGATSASGANDDNDVYVHRNDSLILDDDDDDNNDDELVDSGKSRWVHDEATVFSLLRKLKLSGVLLKRNGKYLKLNGGGPNLNGGTSHFLLLISDLRLILGKLVTNLIVVVGIRTLSPWIFRSNSTFIFKFHEAAALATASVLLTLRLINMSLMFSQMDFLTVSVDFLILEQPADDASMSWRERKKHFFVLSHSGKPILSRYGDEHKLAGFSATLQAIISFVEDGGDRVKLVRAGKHQVVFLVKGPIYLVCISCTEEPYESLHGQLELLYGQMLLILTKSVNRCFEKNPKFDMTPLLGGTDAVFSSLFHSFSWNPATFLHAYTCVPLPYATRQVAGSILQDVADSGVLFAMLMCRNKVFSTAITLLPQVVSLVGAQKVSLHPDDMLLLANFVMTSESFSPICLPRYNPMGFLHAYVHFIDVDTYLVLLTSSSDAFFHLKECRILIEKVLLKSNVLIEVQRSLLKGGMHVEDLPVYPSTRSGSLFDLNDPRLATEPQERLHESILGVGGPGGLWHFIYRSMYFDQYVSSEFSSPISDHRQQKR